MTTVQFPILRGTDLDYYAALRKIAATDAAKELGLSKLSFSFPQNIIDPIQVATFEEADSHEDLQSILRAEGVTISTFTIGGAKNSVAFHRGIHFNGNNETPEDNLKVNFGGQAASKKPLYPLIIAECQKATASLSPSRLATLLGDEADRYMQARELALTRLETTQATLLHDFESIKEKHYADSENERKERETAFQSRLDELESEFASRQKAFDAKEKELKDEKDRLDDRTSTHVRREIRKDLSKELKSRQEKFTLSPDTKTRRRWVLGGYLAVLGCLAGLSIWHLSIESSSSEIGSNYSVVGRQIAATVAFFVTAGFFLRWLNEWAQQHAEEEFRIKQLELDIDRASWVVEMAFEWDESKDNPIPERLIETLSANLFGQDSRKKELSMTAGDAIAKGLTSIPNATAEIEFPGGKVALDKRALKQAAKGNKDE